LFDVVETLEIDGIRIKRSKYPEGKVKLFQGSLERCLELIKDMEFEKCGEVKKEVGYLMSDGTHTVALEKIARSWVLEIEVEGENVREAVKKIKEIMEELGLDRPSATSTRELLGIKCTNTTSPS